MNHNQHDELAQLFAQNMQLAQHTAPAQQQVILESVPRVDEKSTAEPIHYVSSHYTGTAHVRPDATSEPSHSPPPPYNEALMPEAMPTVLRQHSIDPSALLPTQIHLFANADYEARLRLLELWRIAPPSYPLEMHMSEALQPTSVEQEEAEAKVRYERQKLHGRTGFPPEEHMLDTAISEPISPIREAGEPAWPPAARMRAASIAAKLSQPQADAEPYIVSGYEAGHSQATDPVYAAATGLWQAPSYAHAVQEQERRQQQQSSAMEHQYGMYEQIRNHADWEAMNERIAREKFVGVQRSADDDDEMVL